MKIYGNRQATDRLSDYAKNNSMPHALLFFGDSGTGKRTLADYTAMMYFCERGGDAPCMSCDNCKRIGEHIHPDVIYADCAVLKAEELREDILPTTFEKAVEGGMKVYIFSEFQLLNNVCQNALLTYLEEPSPSVRFILTASNRNGILPTILSRTAAVQTFKLSVEECERALSDQGVKNAEETARTYNGNLGLALKSVRDKNAAVYIQLSRELCGYIIDKNEYGAINLLLHLPQPKDDKRGPLKTVVIEAGKIFHDALVTAMGGKPSTGCCPELSEKAAANFSAAALNAIAKETVSFGRAVTETNFNSKITTNAFVAAIFNAMENHCCPKPRLLP
ncbi:MAG TPA: hypothetical protein DDX91_09460 [Ruminococcaceae bacterium]|nr:hypothetical protein [Oscillospiraceae bacterium]